MVKQPGSKGHVWGVMHGCVKNVPKVFNEEDPKRECLTALFHVILPKGRRENDIIRMCFDFSDSL